MRALLVALSMVVLGSPTLAHTNAETGDGLVEDGFESCTVLDLVYDTPPEAGDSHLYEYHWAIDSVEPPNQKGETWVILRFMTEDELREIFPDGSKNHESQILFEGNVLTYCEFERKLEEDPFFDKSVHLGPLRGFFFLYKLCYPHVMKKYVVLEKHVGETPLAAAEAWRANHPEYADTPLAYAGRLDPMASGKLLVLIGEECKQQTKYHSLDKEYVFEVLFGVSSDTSDVLGRLTTEQPTKFNSADITTVAKKLVGSVALPYPAFSSKTVQGKPLHTWTLEGRLDEITIPTKESVVHTLQLTDLRTESAEAIYQTVSQKIETIPPVTEARKALGNDFRRVDVRQDWQHFIDTQRGNQFQIATFRCVATSGTYMRTLAQLLGTELGSTGLAYSIHRTTIGQYRPLPFGFGVWKQRFN